MNNYNDNKAKGKNAVKNAFEKMQNSTFDLRRDGRGDIILAVTNASILWPNFSGTPSPKSKYKNSTKRSFNIVIPEVMTLNDGTTVSVSDLAAGGWNIRNIPLDYEVRDDGIQVYYFNVTVNMDFYKEPVVRTFNTLNGKKYTVDLHGGDVSRLDSDIRDGFVTNIDVEVKGNPRNDADVKPGEPIPCTVYMNKLYAITEPQSTWDDDEKYRGWADSKNVTDDEIIDEVIGSRAN